MPDTFILFLREVDAVIGFAPLPGEEGFGSFLKENGISKNGMSVLAERGGDPFAFATGLKGKFYGKKVVIFIPGREFDASGTRHGRGGGWYDRFLSQVPREWVRVGVLSHTQLSEKPLERKAWDEPMNWLLINTGSTWKIVKT